jgi:WD40 repeat protein
MVTAHRGRTEGLVYSRDGALIAGWTNSGLVFVWDRNRGRSILELLIAAVGDELVTVWDLERRNIASSLGRKSAAVEEVPVVSSVAFSSDGRQLACGICIKRGEFPTRLLAIVVNIADVAVRAVFEERTGKQYRGAPIGLAFSSDDKTLAIGSMLVIALVDPVTARVKKVLSTPRRGLYRCLDFFGLSSPLLAAGAQPGSVPVFDATTGEGVSILQGKERDEPRLQPIVAIALSPDRKRLAASTCGNEVALWELPTGKLLAQIREGAQFGFGAGDSRCWVCFPPDGNGFLTASIGHERNRLFARRRDASAGELVATAELLPPAGIEFVSVPWARGFSPSGNELLGVGNPLEEKAVAELRGADTYREALVIYNTQVVLERHGPRRKGNP